MPNELSAVQLSHILRELDAYGKIKAIKLYRNYAQCTLVEAKDGVERLISQRGKDELEADEPAEIVISIGGYRADWNAATGELRIPFSRSDIADEAMADISMRLEKD